MLKKDNNAHFFEYEHYNDAHRYGFRSGKISIIGEISVEKYKSIMQAQKEHPVYVMHCDSKVSYPLYVESLFKTVDTKCVSAPNVN